jgi:hypothetical protein
MRGFGRGSWRRSAARFVRWLAGVEAPVNSIPTQPTAITTITFYLGQAATSTIAGYFNDADGDTLGFTFVGSAPPGVTFASSGLFTYDGTGSVAVSTNGNYVVADDGAADDITTFFVFSSVGGRVPFTFGQPYKAGDVPSGVDILSDVNEFQTDVKNRWLDGSVFFAIHSGIASVQANTTTTFKLKKGTATSVAPLTESLLTAASINVSVGFSDIGALQVLDLVGVSSSAVHGSNGRIRQWLNGPICSEWHYYSQVTTTDPHTSLLTYLRYYKDGSIWLCQAPENGWVKVSAPGERNYQLQIGVSSVAKVSVSIRHNHHSRWGKEFWYGTDPQTIVLHNTGYFISTKAVPNYAYVSGSAGIAIGYTTDSDVPFALGNWPSVMGDGGYQQTIGLLPKHDVIYLATGHPEARKAVIANAYLHGRYLSHYRDENTLQPIRVSQHAGLGIVDSNSGVDGATGPGSATSVTPTPSATSGAVSSSLRWDRPHHPSAGYLAYLMTGNYYHLEELQFLAGFALLTQSNSSRSGSSIVINYTNRSNGWTIRTVGQAFRATPDTDTFFRDEYVCCLGNTFKSRADFWVSGSGTNDLGVPGLFSSNPNDAYNVSTSNGVWDDAPWQMDFVTGAMGYVSDLELPLSAVTSAALQSFRTHCFKLITGRLGDDAGGFCYRRAAQYYLGWGTPESNPPSTWYTWAEVSSYIFGTSAVTCTNGKSLLGAQADTADFTTSYWSNLMPAIAYAVDYQASGASASWERMTGASNWASNAARFHNDPLWGVSPRSV